MVDTTTIVAYLASDKQERLRNFPPDKKWNSKKWRMLVHTKLDSEGIVYYNKQYPYECEELLSEVDRMVASNIWKHKPLTPFAPIGYRVVRNSFGEDKIIDSNHVNIGGRSFSMKDIIDVQDYLGFSDLISSSSYTPIATLNQELLHIYY